MTSNFKIGGIYCKNVARSKVIRFDLLYYLQIIQSVTCEIGYYLIRLHGLCAIYLYISSICDSFHSIPFSLSL